MNLSPRLMAIARSVPRSHTLADIGTDHGYVPAYLVQKGVLQRAIAADISHGSLRKAEALVQQFELTDRIETRLGSGLSVLTPGEVNTIIIAGMGGLLIKDILEDGQKVAASAATLVLQPMVAQEQLRHWLVHHGYRIEDEELVKEEHRIYEIIIASPGDQALPKDIYYDIGWKLVEKQHPLLEEFVLKKIQGLEEIMERLRISKTHEAMRRMETLKKKLRQYKEVYRWDIKSKTL